MVGDLSTVKTIPTNYKALSIVLQTCAAHRTFRTKVLTREGGNPQRNVLT